MCRLDGPRMIDVIVIGLSRVDRAVITDKEAA
jgi:hypothetical protein